MRSTQNFDPLKVEVVQHDTSVDAEVNTVSENAYGGVDRWDRAVDAEAPDSEIGIARCRTHILELDVGNVVASIACSCTIRSLQVSRSMGAFMYFHGIVWAAYS